MISEPTHSLDDLKVGDYVTRNNYVLLRIVAIIPGTTASATLFGYVNNKSKRGALHWETLYQFKDQGLYKHKGPDFELWDSIRVGDMILVDEAARTYVKVIARIGDAVMISDTPLTRKSRDTFDKVATQLEELSDGEITKKEMSEKLGIPKNSQAAYNTVNQWFTTTALALQHWQLIREEA